MKNSLMNSKILLMFMEGDIENQRGREDLKRSRMRKKTPLMEQGRGAGDWKPNQHLAQETQLWPSRSGIANGSSS